MPLDILIEGSFVAVIAFWVLTHSRDFATVVYGVTHAYTSGVRTLFGN